MSNTLSDPTKTSPFSEALIDKRQLAAFLGLSKPGVTKLIERGVAPPHLRVGRLLRWSPAAVIRWCEDQRTSA
jgi:predicted DNA-binding transcriptional regulator AlpA